jgi:hypothetical protein
MLDKSGFDAPLKARIRGIGELNKSDDLNGKWGG